jgi:hypothetical protein
MHRHHADEYDRVVLKKKWTFKLSKDAPFHNTAKVRDESIPHFSPDAFLEYLVRFIVADDQVSPNNLCLFLTLTYLKVIRVVECPEFRQLCMVLRESLVDADIPHRDKVRESVICRWKEAFGVLKGQLSVSLCAFHVPSMLTLINRNPVER